MCISVQTSLYRVTYFSALWLTTVMKTIIPSVALKKVPATTRGFCWVAMTYPTRWRMRVAIRLYHRGCKTEIGVSAHMRTHSHPSSGCYRLIVPRHIYALPSPAGWCSVSSFPTSPMCFFSRIGTSALTLFILSIITAYFLPPLLCFCHSITSQMFLNFYMKILYCWKCILLLLKIIWR